MVGRRGRIWIGGALVAAVLGLPAVWRMRLHPPPGPAATGSDGGAPAPEGGIAPARPGTDRSPAADAGGLAADAAPAAPDQGPDARAWRNAPMAFGLRELGAMGPYVKAGLDAARRDMEFCFRQEGAPPGAGPGAQEAAVFLLYLEARQGALEVVDARPERMGGATPRLVECCRDVLRGYVIPAFNPVPGRRYRFRFVLE